MRFGTSELLLPHDALVEVVRAWMRVQSRETLRVDELLALRVPPSQDGCRHLLAALAALEAEIATAQARLATDEADLNQRVADYYGLDESDRQIIAGFLVRF